MVCIRSVSRAALCAAMGMLGLASTTAVAETNVLGIEKAAYDGTVPADRPGFFDNVNLVPKGYFIAEGGIRFDDNQGGGSTTTIPSSFLVRSGLTENVELRLGFNGYNLNSPGQDGAADATVGFKFRLHDETKWTPAFSVLPTVSLPVGRDAVSKGKAEPEVHFVFGKSLTDKVSLYSNVNLAQRLDETTGNYDLETAIAIASGYSFSDKLNGYAEYYTVLPENGGRDTHAIDGGLSFFPVPSIQLDSFVGTGLNDATSNIFFGAGIAKLF